MTEEQKEILIAKMLDAPSSLSDEELELIANDDELRDIYEMSACVSGAFTPQPEMDGEEEWRRFRPRLRRKPSSMRWIMRVAAIFLGVTFISGIVGKMVDFIFTQDSQPLIAKVDKAAILPDSSQTIPSSFEPQPQEEPEVKTNVSVNYTLDSKQYIAESGIDIDEYLRIQQARIDNEIAMQVAESYTLEYETLTTLLESVGAYNPELDNIIGVVTME